MKSKLAMFVLFLVCQTGFSQEKPALPSNDRIRLAETFRLAEKIGDRVWPQWSRAPFAVLLVTPNYEFLLRHPKPSSKFVMLGYDPMLKSDVYYRKRTFPITFLATFPLDNTMISTIVVGEAENTWVKTSTPWVITLLHEHFHQLQDSQAGFYEEITKLNLSRGDNTGMWMLNFPFPYDRRDVQDQFARMSQLLVDALHASKSDQTKKLSSYLAERKRFQDMLSPEDYRYISFALWKEGIARYTEYHAARIAAERYRPTREFKALNDYRPFGEVAKQTWDTAIDHVLNEKLGETRREVVYPFGATEGFLLDRVNPGWRSRYFVDKFDLGLYYFRQ